MSELFSQLGIDWRLLASQAVNFLILLTVLRLFAYKPLMKIIADRRARIEEGLEKAEEADKRLAQMNDLAKEKMKEADHAALRVIQDAERRAKDREAALLEEARKKEEALLVEADQILQAKAHEARAKIEKEAAGLVRDAIVKTVELDPKAVDEALIKKALSSAKRTV
ncbi:MAG TPA: F0F1 ATP synthase subunit B [Candidatus Paceibacterota bacterium]|nr:F0F1 ATP synthase subunit B [Candidatus Paceibacterota bacterium]